MTDNATYERIYLDLHVYKQKLVNEEEPYTNHLVPPRACYTLVRLCTAIFLQGSFVMTFKRPDFDINLSDAALTALANTI